MANGQTIHENGRVSALFKVIMGVLGVLIAAGILGIFATLGSLNDSIIELKGELKAQSAISALNNQITKDEYTRIHARLSELERERYRERRDN